MTQEAQMVDVDEVEYDPGYFPRLDVDVNETVPRYTEALKADARFDFPPIVVVRMTGRHHKYLVIDGVHRLFAYQRSGRHRLPAIVEVLPESRWFARSVELNAAHGRPLLTEDRAKIVQRLAKDGWAIDKIASLLKVKVTTIQPCRASQWGDMKPITKKPTPKGRHHAAPGLRQFPNQNGSAPALTPDLTSLDTLIRLLKSGRLNLTPGVLVKLEELNKLLEQLMGSVK